MSGTRVLRADDPEASVLREGGWRVVAESWGARLRLGDPPDPLDLARLRGLVATAADAGYDVRELTAADRPAVAGLEAATAADYPSTPATDAPARTVDRLAELGARCFGARAEGRLVAVTAVLGGSERVETEFTSVAVDHRRRGLATAVKAASVLALADEGHRLFGTGGAAVNAGSLAMNAAVGYEVTERWLSLRRPE